MTDEHQKKNRALEAEHRFVVITFAQKVFICRNIMVDEFEFEASHCEIRTTTMSFTK